jgi:hypothetical protein
VVNVASRALVVGRRKMRSEQVMISARRVGFGSSIPASALTARACGTCDQRRSSACFKRWATAPDSQ